MRSYVRKTWNVISTTLAQIDEVTLIGQLTLVLLILFGPSDWYAETVYRGALVLGVVFPFLVKKWQLWIPLTLITATAHFVDWLPVDNHKWLMLYWLLAFSIGTIVHRFDMQALRDLLRTTAWFMLIFLMFFSVVQKVIGGDYLNGAFFEYTIISEDRFYPIAHFLGGMSNEDFFGNDEQFWPKDGGGNLLPEFKLNTSERITIIALGMSYLLILIELLIPAYLLFRDSLSQNIAHILNGVFVVGVYLVAPVYSFAFFICLLGIASQQKRSPPFIFMYVLLMMLIFLYDEVPWYSIYFYFMGI